MRMKTTLLALSNDWHPTWGCQSEYTMGSAQWKNQRQCTKNHIYSGKQKLFLLSYFKELWCFYLVPPLGAMTIATASGNIIWRWNKYLCKLWLHVNGLASVYHKWIHILYAIKSGFQLTLCKFLTKVLRNFDAKNIKWTLMQKNWKGI